MLNLFRNNTTAVDNAYIITVKSNPNSEKYSARCQESCRQVGMPYAVWDAYDGTRPGEIIPPEQMKNNAFMSMLKITDHYMTRGEVACALSHISLWVHCAMIDTPIVIMEHDAVDKNGVIKVGLFTPSLLMLVTERIVCLSVVPTHMQLILLWLKIYLVTFLKLESLPL